MRVIFKLTSRTMQHDILYTWVMTMIFNNVDSCIVWVVYLLEFIELPLVDSRDTLRMRFICASIVERFSRIKIFSARHRLRKPDGSFLVFA